MDGWRKAYTRYGFEALDDKWERWLIYGFAAWFWIYLGAILLGADELNPDARHWLTMAVASIPGNVRAAFMVALGPQRPKGWDASPADTPPSTKGSSPFTTLAAVLAGVTIAVAGAGYAVTGGNFVDPSDKTTEPPRLRNAPEKQVMLQLINVARAEAGTPPVSMGMNNVAQIQADQVLEDCVSSHWGTDGLKPYHRYSLAGGYQVNGENFSGYGECGLVDTLLFWNDEPAEMIALAMEGLLDSPGHRETMLSPEFRKVNIGLAWSRNVFKVVQHFEGDYVELASLPAINDGRLELEGALSRGNEFTGQFPLLALVVYDPPPQQLGAGQLARTYCYGYGQVIGWFIPPSLLLRDQSEFTQTFEEAECTDPYDVGPAAPGPESQADSIRLFEDSRERAKQVHETELTMTVRKAEDVTIAGRRFSLTADVMDMISEWGPGIYTVMLMAELEGPPTEDPYVPVLEHSIFHEVQAPAGYRPKR